MGQNTSGKNISRVRKSIKYLQGATFEISGYTSFNHFTKKIGLDNTSLILQSWMPLKSDGSGDIDIDDNMYIILNFDIREQMKNSLTKQLDMKIYKKIKSTYGSYLYRSLDLISHKATVKLLNITRKHLYYMLNIDSKNRHVPKFITQGLDELIKLKYLKKYEIKGRGMKAKYRIFLN